MAAIRLVHVSDTHLSDTHGYFAANWAAFRDAMAAAPPDLLVHGGDLSFNGPAAEGDLAFGAAELARLGVAWRAIAGNHDVGEAPDFSRLDQPVNAARLAAWRRHVGPHWWSQDLGDWRLVGLDTALMGSGLAEEAAQAAFLAETLAGRQGRPVMVFVHMPPFDRDVTDAGPSTSVMPHRARGAFLDACAAGGVKVIACGHLHVYRRMRHRGMAIVWAPPTAMVDVRRWQGRLRRFPRPGYVEWTLDGPSATHRLVEPPRMFVIDMSGWTATHGGTTTTLPPLAPL
ncbi:metallophosphoesterase family protein [Falsiroseomonas selenitidurans]|uniref:Metallophosphoesterase n=1 Tax=Falsiroseomonas selenitidurans TaxID=2716335 RepID=A0ABX1E6I9_9PROT|nr:metallophosphoesterase [Falsiroseomonas selenitidurans]NKC32696.1 metallophosphoesterase [Falsiroseomonas selenitidurans]